MTSIVKLVFICPNNEFCATVYDCPAGKYHYNMEDWCSISGVSLSTALLRTPLMTDIGGAKCNKLAFYVKYGQKYWASRSIKTMCNSDDITINTGTMRNILLILITRWCKHMQLMWKWES